MSSGRQAFQSKKGGYIGDISQRNMFQHLQDVTAAKNPEHKQIIPKHTNLGGWQGNSRDKAGNQLLGAKFQQFRPGFGLSTLCQLPTPRLPQRKPRRENIRALEQ